METQLSLAYSTCPNDTFIFHALAERLVDMRDLTFTIDLADVEALNQAADRGVYAVSKLSFAALGHLQGRYRILESGAALGRGCGPLIVTRSNFDPANLAQARIAVPGHWTTANLLLGLFLGRKVRVEALTFDRIMPAVAKGRVDAGVIIHEGRFTFPEYGLSRLVDLGQWWEDETGHPIPLGAIAIRADIAPNIALEVSRAIRSSIEYAYSNPQASDDYIRRHAQELDPEVIRQHIELYVNHYSVQLGDEGRQAVIEMFNRAHRQDIIPAWEGSVFAG